MSINPKIAESSLDTPCEGTPLSLEGAAHLFVISAIAAGSRKRYIRLAAAAGTQQVKTIGMPMVHAIGQPSGYVLSPEEMEAEAA